VTESIADLIDRLAARRETVATAESLTGGLLASTIVDVPGASVVFRGGLVIYATDLKATLAGVPVDLLDERGPVDPDVAAALAAGVRERCGATWGMATTGVAGPTPQDGVAVGTVFVAVSGPSSAGQALRLEGDRRAIRAAAVRAAIALLSTTLDREGGDRQT
jgi:nicotinamide-nucleotide amidase